jgi:hypothetical protein
VSLTPRTFHCLRSSRADPFVRAESCVGKIIWHRWSELRSNAEAMTHRSDLTAVIDTSVRSDPLGGHDARRVRCGRRFTPWLPTNTSRSVCADFRQHPSITRPGVEHADAARTVSRVLPTQQRTQGGLDEPCRVGGSSGRGTVTLPPIINTPSGIVSASGALPLIPTEAPE